MTAQSIKKTFGGKIVGTNTTKNLVSKVVSKLKPDQIEYVTKHFWFFSTPDDTWAYAFHGNQLRDQHVIYLSDELLKEPLEQIQYTILHEIGHILLNHRNSIGFKQTQKEIDTQEEEADRFAYKYL